MSDLTIDSVPTEIRKTLGPYLQRSIELQQFKPIVSYYCKFYITEYIINNKLHLSSPEMGKFTLALLDNMEACKLQLSEQDLKIMQDPTESYDHVELFALSIFHKGYLDIVNHTTTKSTVKVLKNGIEFMTVLKYWGEPLKPIIVKNIKYAKFHIGRILKAYKNGQDPNDYMTPEDLEMGENLDSELQDAVGGENSTTTHTEESLPKPPKDLSEDSGINLPKPPTFIDNDTSSELPKPPTFIDKDTNSELPKPPTFIDNDSSSQIPKPPSFINDIESKSPSPPSHLHQAHLKPNSVSPTTSPLPVSPSPPPVPHHTQPKQLTKQEISQMLSREEKISKTQKLCKFAISALNYEDIDTAVQELKKALEILESESS